MYKLSVSRTGIEKRRRAGRLLHLVAGLLLVLFSGTHYRELTENAAYFLVPVLTIAFISAGYCFLQARIDRYGRLNSGMRLLQAAGFCILALLVEDHAATVLLINLYLLAAVCLYLLVMERQLGRYNYLLVNNQGLLIPQLIGGRHVQWMYVRDVVFRADYVTVFLNNEKFLQVELAQNYTVDKLKEIETFSQRRIVEARKAETSLN